MKAPRVTAGEWRVGSRSGYNACAILAENGKDEHHDTGICQVSGVPLHTQVDEVAANPKWAEGYANARMLAASKRLAEAGNMALAELRSIIKDVGGCDHSVGVCWCTTIHAADALQESLILAGYTPDGAEGRG